jgi:hypothetical protein
MFDDPRMMTEGDVGIKGQVGPPVQTRKLRRSHAPQECEQYASINAPASSFD